MQLPPSKSFELPFIRREQVAKDTYSFFFDRSASPYDFLAGQYIRMLFDTPEPDDRGNNRYFSISSSPLQNDIQMHTTKIVEKSSTFKKHLLELKEGDSVRFFGPLGKFVLDEEETRPQVFLAGGIGITPFHSMLMYAHEKQLPLPLSLFVSFSTVEETIYYNELKALQNDHTKIIYTVTHPEESIELWDGQTGRISAEMLEKYDCVKGNEIYYLCGPEPMVEAMKIMLQEMQIPEEHIREEKFTGY